MKVLLVGLSMVAVIVGGSIGYTSLKTGELPGWVPSARSTEGSETIEAVDSNADGDTTERTDTRSAEAANVGPNDIVITEAELNQMVRDAIATDPTVAAVLDVSETGVQTTIEGDRIESGLSLNLNDLPLEQLPVEAEQAVDELIQTFPFLANQAVYIGIEGSPEIVDGAVSLNDTNVKFGPLKLPVSNVASQLGVSQRDIENQLNEVLAREGLTPESIQVSNGQIVIRG